MERILSRSVRLLDTAPSPTVPAEPIAAEGLSEADRWLILTVLTADPVELPTDLPDLSELVDLLGAPSA